MPAGPTLNFTTMAKRVRGWVVTINNPNGNDFDNILRCVDDKRTQFLVGQCEVGASDTFHLHVFLYLDKPVRGGAKEWVWQYFPRGHREPAKGTPKQAIGYCTKDETRASRERVVVELGADWLGHQDRFDLPGPFVFGDPPMGAGARSDLREWADKVIEKGVEEAALEQPEMFLKYGGRARELAAIVQKRKSKGARDIEVIVINGATGSGKTHRAHEIGEERGGYYLWRPARDDQWFSGYEGEPVLIIEEFRGREQISHARLLGILDKWQFRCNTKGSHTYAAWTTVIITTTHPWQTWYEAGQLATGELERRLTTFIDMGNRRWEDPAAAAAAAAVAGPASMTASMTTSVPDEAGTRHKVGGNSSPNLVPTEDAWYVEHMHVQDDDYAELGRLGTVSVPAAEAYKGLVTSMLDDLDWDDI